MDPRKDILDQIEGLFLICNEDPKYVFVRSIVIFLIYILLTAAPSQ